MADLNYATYVSTLQTLAVIPAGDSNFATDLPNIIADAELRTYRDLDLIDTSARDSSSTLTAGNRNFTYPATASWVVTDEINIITPASSTTADGGTRNALAPCSEEMLNMLWPSVSGSTVPQYFATVNQDFIIVGPWPDASYRIEVVGTVRPAPLSASNTTTILTQWFPDLLIAASMVRVAAFLKNYGAAVDDPKMAVTWEAHYQALFKGADVEEARKKFEGPAWSSKEPAPLANPPRI